MVVNTEKSQSLFLKVFFLSNTVLDARQPAFLSQSLFLKVFFLSEVAA